MNITSIQPNLNMRGNLKPLKGYKGITLKLTDADNQRIEQFQKAITQYTFELMQIEKAYDKTSSGSPKSNFLTDERIRIQHRINMAHEAIRQIKIARFNEQKTKLGKNLDTNI